MDINRSFTEFKEENKMIAKAIDRILQLADPVIKDINGSTYSNKQMFRIDTDMRADPIGCKTLTGLLDYIKANKDNFNGWRGYILHVTDEKTVELISELDNDRRREKIMVAKADTPKLPVGYFMTCEEFVIGVQANFVRSQDTDLAAVLKFAGTVTDGTITDYSDDGVSQKATIKSGIASREEKKVPSPCNLRPYRTFHEVDQPKSSFIFRMRSGVHGPECALYEADGGAWTHVAMSSIGKCLSCELEKAGISLPVIV